MIIMLIGNSLTAGNLGIPYSRYLNLPTDSRIINQGLDGDTLLGVKNRLEAALEMESPDILVIQTGANDILLPEMNSRGGTWKPFVEEMKKRGSLPTENPISFLNIYTEMISVAISSGLNSRRIICATIPPIGENLLSSRNKKRMEYNRSIRRAVKITAACLADIAENFEEELRKIEIPSDWFFSNPADFISDVKEVRRGKGAMNLSKERGLYLTMDGAHLNEKGAELMGRVLSAAINQASCSPSTPKRQFRPLDLAR
ncbi:MAG: hypothetical protein KAH21_04735 [Spirochaetaceae bacterium]|nr:hypothetical protein [Spirochaetaceae bacterium]